MKHWKRVLRIPRHGLVEFIWTKAEYGGFIRIVRINQKSVDRNKAFQEEIKARFPELNQGSP